MALTEEAQPSECSTMTTPPAIKAEAILLPKSSYDDSGILLDDEESVVSSNSNSSSSSTMSSVVTAIQESNRPIISITTSTAGLRPRAMMPRLIHLPPNRAVLRPGSMIRGLQTIPLGRGVQVGGPQTFFFKTTNGTIQMIAVPAGATVRAPNLRPGTRLTAVPVSQASGTGGSPLVALGISTSTTAVITQATSTTPTTTTATSMPIIAKPPPTTSTSTAAAEMSIDMPPEMAKRKCTNFFSTLIRLSSSGTQKEAAVRQLIQALVDDTISAEEFTIKLQKELNSSPQPCLVPFLKKSLPYLRYSLMREELTIDGVRAPNASTVTITSTGMAVGNGTAQAAAAAAAAAAHQQQAAQMTPHTLTQLQHLTTQRQGGQLTTQTVRLITPGQLGQMGGLHHGAQQIITSLAPGSLGTPIMLTSVAGQQQQQQPQLPQSQQPRLPVQSPAMNPSQLVQHHPGGGHQQLVTFGTASAVPHPTPGPVRVPTPSKAKAPSKSKAKEKAASGTGEKTTTSSSFKDGDDINDVPAMGGVNLQEESQRILGTSAEIIGQQIRSCKDEPFLHGTPLHGKISSILKKYELTDCSLDVVALVSHAVQERLKNLVEKLGTIAEHRQEQFKNNTNYEVVQDVKAQVQFLQEVDRAEKKRHEDVERVALMRAAKSRSRMDDPDQRAIRERAKEMQRLEMEEKAQQKANEAALQAIGVPKKRQRVGGSTDGLMDSGEGDRGAGGSGASLKPILKQRIKRVTMKDLHFMLEHQPDTVRSRRLFTMYAR